VQPTGRVQFGLVSPVCGAWLRTRSRAAPLDQRGLVDHAIAADAAGYDFYYVPEHQLNAVHGPEHPLADAWVTAAAAVASTRRLRVVAAVEPGFRNPVVTAKMGAGLAALRPDSFGLSIVAGWWRLQAETFGEGWLDHQQRYQRAGEYLDVVQGLWNQQTFEHEGRYYRVRRGLLRPRPAAPPIVFVAGESDAALELAARAGDYLYINGDDVERVGALGERIRRLARQRGRTVRLALSAFALLRESVAQAQAALQDLLADADLETIRYFEQQMDQAVVAHNRGTTSDRIEANLGLGVGLVGDAPTIVARLRELQRAGVDAVMVKLEGGTAEADRFAAQVVRAFP
jgi:FMNH2-dependent dimethyl sulfone monooxygenase